ncbi:MAG: hypothetical protein CVU95_15075 [Firmicutes bacterium HGW-Firmicutes-2]|jgi:uncharacterized repeat protein (TIGR02543 family)|nr:MAG: hypothetical protein CVU95_15075 [Firmicutes bacterium HGW-Firmicutes-2]
MKKKVLSIILAICMITTLMPSVSLTTQAASTVWNGSQDTSLVETARDGTPGTGYYLVDTAEKLAYIAYLSNHGTNFTGKTVLLTDDIVLNSGNSDDWESTAPTNNWRPIGDSNYNGSNAFLGIFDGQGHTISGLYLKDTLNIRGLFGKIGTSGIVCNVGLINSYLSARQIIGGITGYNEGKITNCWNSATVTTKIKESGDSIDTVGGIAGGNGGTIANCYNTGTIGSAYSYMTGGIVGRNNTSQAGAIKNCYNLGTIISESSAGGIAGSSGTSYCSIQYSYSILGSYPLVGSGIGVITGCGTFTGGSETDYITLNQDSATGYTYTYTNNANNDGTTTTTLLSALNAWVNVAERSDLAMWKIDGGYPIFDKFWEPNYTATVAVNKDGGVWTSSTPTIKLSTSSASLVDAVSGTLSNGVYTFANLENARIYYIWEESTTDTYTGHSVSNASASATLDYFTLALSTDIGTSSPTGNGCYLSGKSVAIDVTVNPGYTWSKWTSSDTALVADKDMKSASIVMPASAVTLTATSTLDIYSIQYALNGGELTTANPLNYNYESSAITLVNPTRNGYAFVGWSGDGLIGNTNQTVIIGASSTGDKSYTANWKANTPTAPLPAIVAEKTDTSLTITTETGYEYSVNGTNWYSGIGNYTFTGLTAATAYNLVRRVGAVATGDISAASDASAALSVTTKAVGSVTVPTPAAVTYDPAKTLADITLAANWAWSAPATVPTVAINSYSAVYTPTDTATVDYSGEAGYANTSGTVTITRTIALTVNRATPTAADFTYDAPAALDYSGTAKTATVTAKGNISGMGPVTVKYYLGAVETTPTNVGTYTVEIDIAQGGNYEAASAVTDGTWTFTIEKMAQAPLSITNKPIDVVTHGDTFMLATTGGSGTGAVTWEVTDGTSATVNVNTGAVTITGVNETTITATRATDGNYLADVTDTYTFTPVKLQLTVAIPTATGGWIKTYDGNMEFDKSTITVGGMTNRVGSDDVTVSVASATYNTADVGSGDKTLTITYVIAGAHSENYSAPANSVVNTASITAATPIIALVTKTTVYTGSIIGIAAATVTGVAAENDITTNYAGVITYTYYTKDTCTDGDETTEDNSGAEAIGGAPKNAGTYYVKATIGSNGNYTGAASPVVTLTIYHPSSGGGTSASSTPSTGVPVIVDGKTVDMGISEVKDDTTTVTVDPIKMSEQLKNTMDSVVIPITSKTGTASAQLVVKNVESMDERGVSLTIIAGNVSYSIPSGAIDTSAALKALGASDSSKVPLNITISKLSNSSVTIQNGTLMVPPVAFTVTATYNGKSIAVERFESYVQRVIDIPDGTDPKSITTAVVIEANGTQRHVPTEVYSENGKWYARINAMTNSTYALIQNSVSFTDSKGKWYNATVTEMASREIISGVGENMFAGERAITRAEFTAIIVRAMGLPTNSTAAGAFSDVSANKWYYGAVGTAYEYGLVTGKGEVQFDPTGNITRQEAMVILQRSAKLTDFIGKTSILSAFSDSDSVDEWALEAAKWNVGSGLIMGNKGQLRPTDNISRAETAAVILRLLQMAELIDVRS